MPSDADDAAPVADLAGDHVVVTSGPTREWIDPVRYISNRSSGKMGHSLAVAARRRGATVVLISGPTVLDHPAGVTCVDVETALQMRDAAHAHLAASTIVIKAAAVADYRVAAPLAQKIASRKDRPLALELIPNPDILRELAARRTGAFLVGFAAETHDLRDHAAAKLRTKGVDLLVANDVSRAGIGFEADDNEALLLDRWGGVLALPRMSKRRMADAILDRVRHLRAGPPR